MTMISMRLLLAWLFALLLSPLAASRSGAVSISHGLQNLGNTCYLNSQLQCAYHIPLVRSIVEEGMSSFPNAAAADKKIEVEDTQEGEEENTDSASSIKTDSTQDEDEFNEEFKVQEPEARLPQPESVATVALRKVFQDMKSSSGAVAPRVLCQMLGIPVFEQQDSQEFWKLLLPALKLPHLIDLYQGCFEDFITAAEPSDSRERRREEPFLDLSLDVNENVFESLKKSFGSAELLSVAEGNGWRPEKGADKVDALKGCLLRVQGLPSVLQLHLKRFNYDWQRDKMNKINSPCTFPEELDLSSICADIQDSEKSRACFALQSVVIHVGEFGSGHYYAYVRPDILSQDWYRFNDHVVQRVSFDEVVADAYGGRSAKTESSDRDNNRRKKKGGLLKRLGSIFNSKGDPYGYGGKTSNAYVIQYVKKMDIPKLYFLDDQK